MEGLKPSILLIHKQTNYMIKVYEAIRLNSARLITQYLNVSIELNFINGNTLQGKNAELITNNKFIQDAIEHDSRYGVTIRLKRTYQEELDSEEKTKTKKQKKQNVDGSKVISEVKNINDAISYFISKGEMVADDSDIEKLKEKYHVTFPNLK